MTSDRRPERIAFRVAANSTIGGGHVIRSISIANALAAAGASCTFFTNAEAIASVPQLKRSSHSLVVSPTDTQEAISIAENHGSFDWLVVDDYSLDATDETPWRKIAHKIAVVDDLADRPHDCDLLIDTTPARQADDYRNLVRRDTTLLIGPTYVPLRAEFAEKRLPALAKRAATARPMRLLVSFGLTDPAGITAEAITGINQILPSLEMDVVLGPQSTSLAKIETLHRSRITIHQDPPSMSDLMIESDIALGAGGSTSWERACLGLPSIVVIVAENQRAFAEFSDRNGILRAFNRNQVQWSNVATAIHHLLSDRSAWQDMSRKAAAFCDGQGGHRIARQILRLS